MLLRLIFKSIKLILPALVPSWRFFSEIAPSPRVEYCVQETPQSPAGPWQEFRPRPQHVSLPRMIMRMLWNPAWNESLFLVSCAERLIEAPTAHRVSEIQSRILREILKGPRLPIGARFSFRLVFVHREQTQGPDPRGDQIVKEIEFESPAFEINSKLPYAL